MNEILKHKFNGYLASPFNEKDLAKGVNYVVKNIKHKKLVFIKKVLRMFNEKNNLKQYSKIINNYSLNHK